MKQKILLAVLIAATLFASCKQEILPPDISGVETAEYVLNIGDKLVLAPNITNLKGNSYVWLLDGKEVASGETDYTFTAEKPGNYILVFKATNKGGTGEKAFKILVEKEISIAFENNDFTIPKLKVLDIKPNISGPERNDYEYEWAIGDSIISNERDLEFISLAYDTTYTVSLTAKAGKQTATATCKVKVENKEYNADPNTLFDYRPAPGCNWAEISIDQMMDEPIHLLASYDDFLQTYTKRLREKNPELDLFLDISEWGSYAVFGFDHSVINIPDKDDVLVDMGNPRYSFLISVYVAQDKNRNGKPDDEWYEIKNTDYGNETVQDYERTYTLLEASVEPAGDDEVHTKYKYKWEDNQTEGEKGNGEFIRDEIHSNNWSYEIYPGYFLNKGKIEHYDGWGETFTLKGKFFSKRNPAPYGYSREHNVKNAVNGKGEPANLRYFDFIKIQRVGEVYWQDEEMPMYIGTPISYIMDRNLIDN